MQVIYGIETLLLCVIIFISVVFSLKISFSNYETNLYEIHGHQICNLLKYCNVHIKSEKILFLKTQSFDP